MAVQPEFDAEAVLSQARGISDALDLFEARLAAPVSNLDETTAALAEPARALTLATKEG